ncbi:hypothetical protein OPV22_014069 [Ensete ventricosum]|uniref:Uncharacterized protein n=1 Tax=Ensete ventricosum TaxID=4639 RepID=A0AAV8R2G7_ENSVE|nr:hypothetical protein OPV22_014069 [Ensete ventricosum]
MDRYFFEDMILGILSNMLATSLEYQSCRLQIACLRGVAISANLLNHKATLHVNIVLASLSFKGNSRLLGSFKEFIDDGISFLCATRIYDLPSLLNAFFIGQWQPLLTSSSRTFQPC